MAIAKAEKKIIVQGSKGHIIFEGKISSFPLREELVLEKCKEFFNDEAPCFIHRSAAMKRLFMELECFLEEQGQKGIKEFSWCNIPQQVRHILQNNQRIERIIYTKA